MKPYWQAEEEARAVKTDMWSQGNNISPREWRKTHQNSYLRTPGN